MQAWTHRMLAEAASTGPVEAAAVVLGFLYVVLAIRQRRACWIAGGLSTALYIVVFVDARLYMQALLQVLYVALAIQGFRAWGAAEGGEEITVRHLAPRWHLASLAFVALATLLSAPLLTHFSDSLSWADALGTWASVVATWLMIRKVAANWLWWLVVDPALAVLYGSQGLLFSALLYLAFGGLALAGWLAWRRAPEVAALG